MEEFPELKEKLRIIIFCGGYGTRMWPMSRQSLPKQFQALLGEKSFFQDALERVKLGFKNEDIFIAIPEEQAKLLKRQARDIPRANIISEPERRDTLGAVGYATAFIEKRFPNSLMAVVWGADHLVKKKEEFIHLLKLAARVCQKQDVICKIDVKPTYPSTANGWVKLGKTLGKVDGHPLYELVHFVEKPALEKAKKMFTDEHFLINTGYFVWRSSVMLKLYKRYAPETYSRLEKILKTMGEASESKILREEYRRIEKTSVDFGLYEKLPPGKMVVIPADIGWYDVGTWSLLYEALARGQKQNIAKGEVEFLDSHGNLVYLPKKKIAAIIGVNRLIVVDTEDGLLVCSRDRAEAVKQFVELLKTKNKKEYL